MAEDLQRFINDEPIQARRISLAERIVRWGRRNKALAASLSVVASLMLVVATGSTIAAGYFQNCRLPRPMRRNGPRQTRKAGWPAKKRRSDWQPS